MFSRILAASATSQLETGTTVLIAEPINTQASSRQVWGQAADDLGDGLGGIVLVARVFAFGRKGQVEILSGLQAASARGSAASPRGWCRDRWCFPGRSTGLCADTARWSGGCSRCTACPVRGSWSAGWARRSERSQLADLATYRRWRWNFLAVHEGLDLFVRNMLDDAAAGVEA